MKLWLTVEQAAKLADLSVRHFLRKYMNEEDGCIIPRHEFPTRHGTKLFILKKDFDRIVLGTCEVEQAGPQVEILATEAQPVKPGGKTRSELIRASRAKTRDPKIRKDICDLYQLGHHAEEIARPYGFNKSVVFHILKAEGVTIRRPAGKRKGDFSYSPEIAIEVVGLYKAGKSEPEIGRLASLSRGTVNLILKRAGIERRPKGSRYTGRCVVCEKPTASGRRKYFKPRCDLHRRQYKADLRVGRLLEETRLEPRHDNVATIGEWHIGQSGYGGPRMWKMRHKLVK